MATASMSGHEMVISFDSAEEGRECVAILGVMIATCDAGITMDRSSPFSPELPVKLKLSRFAAGRARLDVALIDLAGAIIGVHTGMVGTALGRRLGSLGSAMADALVIS